MAVCWRSFCISSTVPTGSSEQRMSSALRGGLPPRARPAVAGQAHTRLRRDAHGKRHQPVVVARREGGGVAAQDELNWPTAGGAPSATAWGCTSRENAAPVNIAAKP